MKKTLLLLTALFFVTACTSTPSVTASNKVENDTKETVELKTALNEYTQATMDNDVTKLISFVYPKVFTVVAKEKMTEVLQAAYNSPNAPTVKNVKHLNIEPIEKYDEGKFAIITSSMTTLIKSPRPGDERFEAYMLSMLNKGLHNGDNVDFDKENHLFTVNHQSKTVAINENSGWKFAGITQAKKYAEKGILPQAIVNKIQ